MLEPLRSTCGRHHGARQHARPHDRQLPFGGGEGTPLDMWWRALAALADASGAPPPYLGARGKQRRHAPLVGCGRRAVGRTPRLQPFPGRRRVRHLVQPAPRQLLGKPLARNLAQMLFKRLRVQPVVVCARVRQIPSMPGRLLVLLQQQRKALVVGVVKDSQVRSAGDLPVRLVRLLALLAVEDHGDPLGGRRVSHELGHQLRAVAVDDRNLRRHRAERSFDEIDRRHLDGGDAEAVQRVHQRRQPAVPPLLDDVRNASSAAR
mmetsp:Transcript_50952/g.141018  ORF Transcript_50952/g.141018 Transcript_50952/m.141018 type:complete len:263 (+) Transcript_50952:507-1295(+)